MKEFKKFDKLKILKKSIDEAESVILNSKI